MIDWRNAPVERACRRCSVAFEGKYNSSTCPPCRERVKQDAHDRFVERSPDYWKDWAANGRTRPYRLKAQYGMTEADWDQMHAAQGGACAVCGATGGWSANGGRLVVDHCHETGRVRGLLCPSCNRGLGQFEDDPSRIAAAIEYLERRKRNV